MKNSYWAVIVNVMKIELRSELAFRVVDHVIKRIAIWTAQSSKIPCGRSSELLALFRDNIFQMFKDFVNMKIKLQYVFGTIGVGLYHIITGLLLI